MRRTSYGFRVLSSKYMKNDLRINNIMYNQKSSNAWRGIVQAKDILAKGIRKLIRNGQAMHFRLDS